MCSFCKVQYTIIFSIAAVPRSIHFPLPNGYTSKLFLKISQWGLSESVLPLPSHIVKNSLHCFPGWTRLQMSREPDSCSAQALLAGRLLLSGLFLELAGKMWMAAATPHLPEKFQKELRTAGLNCLLPRKPWDPSKMGLTGESGQVTNKGN